MSALMLTGVLTGCGSADENIYVTENNSLTQTAAEKSIYALNSAASTHDTEQTSAVGSDSIIAAAFSEIISLSTPAEADMLRKNTNAAPSKNEKGERAPIVFVSVDESYAWSYYQYVSVLDADGYCYRFETEDETKRINIYDGGWYDKILEIKPASDKVWVSEKTMKRITDFTENLTDYKDLPMKSYWELECYDSGTKSVYGICYDNSGAPQYIKLCSYGEEAECLDSEEVREFANEMQSKAEMSYFFWYNFGEFPD